MSRVMTALLMFGFVASANAAESPNVVLFYCDDMGYADIGPYGGRTPTPNLDRLAREGVRFTDFYVTQAVCSASRASLLTGCYNLRVGIVGALGPKNKIGINPDERLIPEVFKSKGYVTAMYGKWHLGDAPKFLPTSHGFDEWFGVPYSHDMWPRHPANPKAYPDLPLMEGEQVLKLNPEPGELTAAITDRAVKFIERSKDKPFFLYIPHPLPHVPLGVSRPFEGKTGKGLYADVIAEIDQSVGAVLDAIRKAGIDGNTLVMFSSDNGPWLLYGDHAGSATPLREGKATAFDGGVRVPFIARWPGRIPAGAVCKEVAATIDVLPTMAKLIGAADSEKKIDGKDIWSLMTQPDARSPHEFFAIYWGRELHAIRSGKWKMHFAHGYPKPSPPGGDAKPGKYAQQQIGDELFDMETDPGEKNNVASANPDVVAKIKAYAEQIRDDLGEARTKQQGKGLREPGRL